MFDRNLTMRIDDKTDILLKDLSNEFNFSKAEIIRHALRLMNKLNEIQKQNHDINIITSSGEKILLLIC